MEEKEGRHPTEKKVSVTTNSHTSTSTKDKDKALLFYLYNNPKALLNVRRYSINNSIPRTTVYDIIERCKRLGLITHESGITKLTEKGINYLNSIQEGMSDSVRSQCRTSANLSTHYHKYKLPISDKSLFQENNLKKLNPITKLQNNLPNLSQTILRFSDATIIINPKQILIHIPELVSEDIESEEYQSITILLKYQQRLREIGIITEGAFVEEGEWARVDSVLANFIYNKIDQRYFLELNDGSKFWIDCSGKDLLGRNRPEDETNRKDIRIRIDEYMLDMLKSNSLMSDVDKLKEISSYLVQIELSKVKLELSKSEDLKKESEIKKPYVRDSYFG